MSEKLDSLRYEKAKEKYNAMLNKYLEKFGENSLEGVVYCDPVHMHWIDELEGATETLENAIKKNKALPIFVDNPDIPVIY